MLGNFILSFLPTQPQKSYKGRGKQQLDWKQKIKVRLEGYPDQVVERIISILGFVMASTRDVNPQELEIARRTQVKAALDRESGASLYRVVKAMKKFRGQ